MMSVATARRPVHSTDLIGQQDPLSGDEAVLQRSQWAGIAIIVSETDDDVFVRFARGPDGGILPLCTAPRVVLLS